MSDVTRADLAAVEERISGEIHALAQRFDELKGESVERRVQAEVAKVRAEQVAADIAALMMGVNKDRDDLREWKKQEFYPLREEIRIGRWKLIAIVAGSGTAGGLLGKIATWLLEHGG